MTDKITKEEASKQLRGLHEEFKKLDVWSRAHSIMRKTGLDDSLFFAHPVKSPFLVIYDNLINLANALEELSKKDEIEEMTMEEVCAALGKTIKIKK